MILNGVVADLMTCSARLCEATRNGSGEHGDRDQSESIQRTG